MTPLPSSPRAAFAALVAAVALQGLLPVHAQTVIRLPAPQQPTADILAPAHRLPPGQTLRLENLPLSEDGSVLPVAAELRRTERVGRALPRLFVHTGAQVLEEPLQEERSYFSGKLADEPDSSVFLVIDAQGNGRSIVERGGEVFVNEILTDASGQPAHMQAQRVDPQRDFADRPFSCGVTPEFIEQHATPPSAAFTQALQQSSARTLLRSLPAAVPTELRRADIIVETDYEMYQNLGSNAQAVRNYVSDLFAYISTRYESEAGARLAVTQVHVQTSAAQPWTGSRTDTLLDQLQARWNDSSRISQARHHVHLLSGKDGGGVAYVDTLGSNSRSYAYGVSAGIEGGFQTSSPQIVWDAVVVAHEIGHAFGSSHTHGFDAPYRGSPAGGAIDCCYSEDPGSQCALQLGGAPRYGVLPGIGSRTGGSSGMRQGSIMSYCHTLLGGLSNIAFTFGTGHAYGVNPLRVPQVLQSAAQAYLPIDTSPPPPVTYGLNVSHSGAGTGVISSNPTGIQCGSDCSEAYAAGTSVTLLATPDSSSNFAGWSGACSGTSPSCNVTMDSTRQVVATFTPKPATRMVSVTVTGNGQVTSTPDGLLCSLGCSFAVANLPATSPIYLQALPGPGDYFAGWGGACSQAGNNPVCTLAAGTQSLQAAASFKSITGGGGGGDGPLADPARFVSQQYLDFLQRAPDAAGLTYWVQQLGSGASTRAQLIESLMYSQEFAGRFAPLVRLYSAYFRRLPDYAGLMYWFDRMHPANGSQGVAWTEVSNAFASSAEFIGTYGTLNDAAFVDRVYRNVLGRAPDTAGLNYWVGRLAGGMSRGDVMLGFSDSTENQAATSQSVLVTMTYLGMLRRTPDAAGHAWWLAEVKAGRTTVRSLIDGVLASPEYAARF